jgi:shikimate dehydrogenase
VDIDYRFARPVPPAEVIASYHNFEETPDNLVEIVGKAFGCDAAIAKVATQVNRWADNRRLLDLLAKPNPKPLIISGMGDIGQITRLVGPSRGSFLSYAASARKAAPGQMNVTEMLDTYKFRRIRRSTRILGILGMPVGHSLSPVLHNRAFALSDLDFAYVKLPAPDVNDFMENARAVGLSGFSVTIPHKIAMVPFMSRLTAAANAVGAVNTVSDENGKWVGDNTDVHGVEMALQSVGFSARGKKVVIMGKGGGAKAAAAALKEAAEVRILPRNEIFAAGSTPCDLLINATPVGMFPKVEDSPVTGAIAADFVFDMVYNPASTTLLRAAASQGKTTVPGTRMFFAQAARQFEIWTKQPAPREVYASE